VGYRRAVSVARPFSRRPARITGLYETNDQHTQALAAAWLLLVHDPLQELAHRAAMRVFARLGRRNAALEQYRRCRETIARELNTEPMAETTELYQAIRDGRFAADTVQQFSRLVLSGKPKG
jgi:DNA-binding SARP family transcriptional activator